MRPWTMAEQFYPRPVPITKLVMYDSGVVMTRNSQSV